MNKDFILKIIDDFDAKAIPDFFNLDKYETDYEISRHFMRMLRIGYIKKEDIESPQKAIYINFERKHFAITVFCKHVMIEKTIFKDDYHNYNSVEEVYQKVLFICRNKDLFENN